jgi:hypothetical protein
MIELQRQLNSLWSAYNDAVQDHAPLESFKEIWRASEVFVDSLPIHSRSCPIPREICASILLLKIMLTQNVQPFDMIKEQPKRMWVNAGVASEDPVLGDQNDQTFF